MEPNQEAIFADALIKVVVSHIDYQQVVGKIMSDSDMKNRLVRQCVDAVTDAVDSQNFEEHIVKHHLDVDAVQDRVVDHFIEEVSLDDSAVQDRVVDHFIEEVSCEDIKSAVVESIIDDIETSDIIEEIAGLLVNNIGKEEILRSYISKLNFDVITREAANVIFKDLTTAKYNDLVKAICNTVVEQHGNYLVKAIDYDKLAVAICKVMAKSVQSVNQS